MKTLLFSPRVSRVEWFGASMVGSALSRDDYVMAIVYAVIFAVIQMWGEK